MEKYKLWQKVEEGFELDDRGFTYGDSVICTEDIVINNEPFFENIVVPKGSKGIIKGLDIERTTYIKMINNKPTPIMYRGHKVRFDMFDNIEFFHESFNVEVEPYKLEKVDMEEK